jgi:hypothetical protein
VQQLLDEFERLKGPTVRDELLNGVVSACRDQLELVLTRSIEYGDVEEQDAASHRVRALRLPRRRS